MDIDERDRLSLLNDSDKSAVAVRLRAAIEATGMNQKVLAEAMGINRTTLNAAVVGRVYPSNEVMRYLYRIHRIDYNFMLNGNLSQLPGDVQERLLSALPAAHSGRDQREG